MINLPVFPITDASINEEFEFSKVPYLYLKGPENSWFCLLLVNRTLCFSIFPMESPLFYKVKPNEKLLKLLNGVLKGNEYKEKCESLLNLYREVKGQLGD